MCVLFILLAILFYLLTSALTSRQESPWKVLMICKKCNNMNEIHQFIVARAVNEGETVFCEYCGQGYKVKLNEQQLRGFKFYEVDEHQNTPKQLSLNFRKRI